ncbi:MAG: MFS transporter [Actinomycetota bacterium]|nr:MFS transporter [Actinomycetota bacterium]
MASRAESEATAVATGVHSPAFRRLWGAWTVSLCGDGVRTLALPLYVAVQTRDALAASAVAAAEVLPWLLVALPAGALVDRLPPRTVLLTTHVVRVGLTAGLVGALATGMATVPVLCAFALLLTTAETFAYPASQVMLVALADGELDQANARFFAVNTLGLNFVGPLVAGAVFLVDPALAFAIDGMTFVAAAVLVATLPAVAHPERKQDVRTLWAEVGEGLRLLYAIPGLRTLVSMVAIGTLAIAAVNTLLPLYAVEILSMGSVEVSTLLVVLASGTLLGTWLAPQVSPRWGDGPVMVTGMGINGIGIALIGLVPTATAAWSGNALMGIGLGLWNVLSAARRQRLTPATAMGRVSGAYRVVAWGLMPLGAATAGSIAAVTSLNTPLVLAGAVTLIAVTALAVPLLRTGTRGPRQQEGRPVVSRRA